MKFRTTILVLLAIAGSVYMTSCTKSYTCQCSIVYSGYPGLPDSTEQTYTIIDNSSGAKSKCQANSVTNTDASTGIKSVETCTLY